MQDPLNTETEGSQQRDSDNVAIGGGVDSNEQGAHHYSYKCKNQFVLPERSRRGGPICVELDLDIRVTINKNKKLKPVLTCRQMMRRRHASEMRPEEMDEADEGQQQQQQQQQKKDQEERKTPKEGRQHQKKTPKEGRPEKNDDLLTDGGEEEPLSSDADSHKPIKHYPMVVCKNEQPTELLIRAMSISHASQNFDRYHKRDFLVYYRLTRRNLTSIDSIPLEVPLMIAYGGRPAILHCQVKCYVGVGAKEDRIEEELWSAVKVKDDDDADDDNPTTEAQQQQQKRQAPAKTTSIIELPENKLDPWQLGFSSLHKLLEYFAALNAKCEFTLPY